MPEQGMAGCDVGSWKDVVQVAAGESYTVGLKGDGTVVAVGNTRVGQMRREQLEGHRAGGRWALSYGGREKRRQHGRGGKKRL